MNIKIETINGKLRDTIVNLYNHYRASGYSNSDALDMVWAYWTQGFDPLSELSKMGFSRLEELMLKKYTLRLIYSDLYEEGLNNPIIESDSYEERFATIFPVLVVLFYGTIIPENKDLRNRILENFILLQEDNNRKRDNRLNTISKGQIKVLKKVNPTYYLDELTF